MTTLIFTLIVSLFADGKIDYAQKIHELCMARFPRTVDTRKFTCDCEARNLKVKAKDKDLKFLFDYFKTKKLAPKITDEQNMLIEFSVSVAEECVKDYKWNMERP